MNYVVIIIIVCILLTLYKPKQKTKVNEKILVLGRLSCPYTVKLLDELKKKKVINMCEFISTETEYGKQLFEKSGASGVPCCIYNDIVVDGYMKAEKLLKKLKIKA